MGCRATVSNYEANHRYSFHTLGFGVSCMLVLFNFLYGLYFEFALSKLQHWHFCLLLNSQSVELDFCISCLLPLLPTPIFMSLYNGQASSRVLWLFVLCVCEIHFLFHLELAIGIDCVVS
jgi:hypothetical protein